MGCSLLLLLFAVLVVLLLTAASKLKTYFRPNVASACSNIDAAAL